MDLRAHRGSPEFENVERGLLTKNSMSSSPRNQSLRGSWRGYCLYPGRHQGSGAESFNLAATHPQTQCHKLSTVQHRLRAVQDNCGGAYCQVGVAGEPHPHSSFPLGASLGLLRTHASVPYSHPQGWRCSDPDNRRRPLFALALQFPLSLQMDFGDGCW